MAMTVLHQLNNCVTEYVYIILSFTRAVTGILQAACPDGIWWYTKHSTEIPAPYNSLSLDLMFGHTAKLIFSVSSQKLIQMHGQI